MSVVIRPETGQDQEAIWSVNQAAFEGAELESLLCCSLRQRVCEY
jgi:predicted N-acetyltransferase YhbS